MCVGASVSVSLEQVDESKYSVAMASALYTELLYHCEGRPGVILGSLINLASLMCNAMSRI